MRVTMASAGAELSQVQISPETDAAGEGMEPYMPHSQWSGEQLDDLLPRIEADDRLQDPNPDEVNGTYQKEIEIPRMIQEEETVRHGRRRGRRPLPRLRWARQAAWECKLWWAKGQGGRGDAHTRLAAQRGRVPAKPNKPHT